MLENARRDRADQAVPAEQVFAREPVLQAKAKEFMARICFDEVDAHCQRIGKNISGAAWTPTSPAATTASSNGKPSPW
jgi:hypothetical protein